MYRLEKQSFITRSNKYLLFILLQSNLERRLSLSESVANKNTEAAQSTTEQLLKANQIITKQNNDLLEIKDKVTL